MAPVKNGEEHADLILHNGKIATNDPTQPVVSALYWLVSGRTCGGLALYPERNRLTREEALRLYTTGSAGFSGEAERKGSLVAGQFADLAVLSADYFAIPEIELKALESVLTLVGGKVVYAAQEFRPLDPPALPVLPAWSPLARYGGYGAPLLARHAERTPTPMHRHAHAAHHHHHDGLGGCMCWAF